MIKEEASREQSGRDSVLKWTDRQSLQSAVMCKQFSAVISKLSVAEEQRER